MGLNPGTRLGAYEILSALGAGGMGEVYRATDTRLDRIVAIKVMPSHVAATPELRQRFEREARTIASLNHPHICTLHDVGRHDGTDFLVMEFLDGQTLEERIRRVAGFGAPALQVDEALAIAVQIADALAAAHRAGIVHRDLKPGNIMLTKSGATLLDFGLAKSGAAAVTGPGPSMLETRPPFDGAQGRPNLTAEGTILGTFQYMAPEQLEGHEADARTDIFAFGAVLYEMLTGTKAFVGKSQASLIGAILRDTPPAVSTRQPLVPTALDRIVAACLAKDPADRWQAARDIMLQLQWIAERPGATAVVTAAARPRHREKLAWALAAVCFLGGIALLGSRYFASAEPELGAVRFDVEVPASPGADIPNLSYLAVSPDGRRIVFEAGSQVDNSRSLWVRSLDSALAQALPGTEGTALNPFWSPDSRSIGFFSEGKLKTISTAGGPPRTLCDAPSGSSGTWSRDGVILFASAPNQGGPISRVPETGGAPVVVTTLDQSRNDRAHGHPHFLPDAQHFLFLATNHDIDRSAVYVGSLDSPETRLVESVASSVAYAPPGYLLFARDGTLMARRFDAGRQEAAGEPLPLTEVRQGTGTNRAAAFSVSGSNVLAYQAPISSESRLVWIARDGTVAGGFPSRGSIHTFWLAPDQRRAVVEQGNDLWLLDAMRGTASRFTTDPLIEGHPVWSPDGRRIAFFSGQPGISAALMIKVATGVAEAEPIVQTPTYKQFTDWSSDGRTLVFEERNIETDYDISVVSADGDRTPRPVIRSRFQERMGTLSPDGRYLAYTSNETGRTEVYVVTFPDVSDKWTISTNGGTAPRWRQDGSELFFVDAVGMLVSVPVSRGDGFAVGVPKPLIELQAVQTDGWNYAVSADGQRILAARPTETATTPITVVVNWTALLKQ